MTLISLSPTNNNSQNPAQKTTESGTDASANGKGNVNLISEANLQQCMVKMDTGQESLLREYHTKAKQKYEEYKSYHDHAGRMYYAIHTLLNNSLQSTKSEVLEKYIRNNAEAMGKSPNVFDVNEWEHGLRLAKTCRLTTPEVISAQAEYFKKESRTLLMPTLTKAQTAIQEMNNVKTTMESDFLQFQRSFSGFQQQILTVLSKFARHDWLRKAALTEEIQLDLDREIEKTIALEGQIDVLTQEVKTLRLQRTQERDHWQQQIQSLTSALAASAAAASAVMSPPSSPTPSTPSSSTPTLSTTTPTPGSTAPGTTNDPENTTSSPVPVPVSDPVPEPTAQAPVLGTAQAPVQAQVPVPVPAPVPGVVQSPFPFEIEIDGTFRGPPFPTNCHCKGRPVLKLVANLNAEIDRLKSELDQVC